MLDKNYVFFNFILILKRKHASYVSLQDSFRFEGASNKYLENKSRGVTSTISAIVKNIIESIFLAASFHSVMFFSIFSFFSISFRFKRFVFSIDLNICCKINLSAA